MSTVTLGQFVRAVANSEATDAEAQRALLSKLYEIKVSARSLNNPELGFLLDAGTDLLRYLADGTQPSLQAMLTMVTRLMVNAECAMYRGLEFMEDGQLEARELEEAEAAAATRAQSAPVRELKLAAPPQGLDPQEQASLPPPLPARPSGSPIPDPGRLRIGPSAEPIHPAANTRDMNGMRIGQVLVELGLIEPARIHDALSVQASENCRLGEALIRMGHIMPEGLQEALELQKKMREYASHGRGEDGWDTTKVGVGEWQESLLGALLVQRKAVKEEELREALSIARATGMRLGEALVHHGYCDWRTVRQVIRDQERMRHQQKGRSSIQLPPGGGGDHWQ